MTLYKASNLPLEYKIDKEMFRLIAEVNEKYGEIKQGSSISLGLVNRMHEILLDSVRGAKKNPGQIRTTQNWIGPRGVGIEGATFIPPIPEEVPALLLNLYEYMNDEFIDPKLVNLAVSHAQFETIHAYKDGNGRLGRALIPVQMALLDEENRSNKR